MSISVDTKFLGERAEWLATLLLTRVPGLQVTAAKDEESDLLVAIQQDGIPTTRRFEVVVKSEVTLSSGEHLVQNKELHRLELQDSSRILKRYKDSPIPVVLFYFQMRQNDEAWYRWVVEPLVDSSSLSHTRLKVKSEGKMEKLDQDALNAIVHLVNDWYDSRSNS